MTKQTINAPAAFEETRKSIIDSPRSHRILLYFTQRRLWVTCGEWDTEQNRFVPDTLPTWLTKADHPTYWQEIPE